MSFRQTIKHLAARLPLRDVILLESYPCYSDSSKAVFEEMIRRGWNRRFRMVWLRSDHPQPELRLPNVSFVSDGPGVLARLRWLYLRCTARVLISGNRFLPKVRPDQYALYLAHGAALKNCSSHYPLPAGIDEVISLSPALRKEDAANISCAPDLLLPLGFPRNDSLFAPPLDVHSLFPQARFSKLVYWMPTYRQMKGFSMAHASAGMPLLHSREIARQVNACAEAAGVLVVIKPHPAQELSGINTDSLSNLLFIDDAFLLANGVDNYALLRSADALLTDYSSVYYDYLLLDRPIGLCWDDFEEYREREGFQVDVDAVMAGGEKLYTADDLCAFLGEIARGEDRLKAQRDAVSAMIHQYRDSGAAQRVTDHIAEALHLS